MFNYNDINILEILVSDSLRDCVHGINDYNFDLSSLLSLFCKLEDLRNEDK